jgi:hypothetical protein
MHMYGSRPEMAHRYRATMRREEAGIDRRLDTFERGQKSPSNRCYTLIVRLDANMASKIREELRRVEEELSRTRKSSGNGKPLAHTIKALKEPKRTKLSFTLRDMIEYENGSKEVYKTTVAVYAHVVAVDTSRRLLLVDLGDSQPPILFGTWVLYSQRDWNVIAQLPQCKSRHKKSLA